MSVCIDLSGASSLVIGLTMEPPAYNTHPAPGPENHSELPNYVDSFQDAAVLLSRAPRLSTHVYGIRKKLDGPEWLILRVTSRSKSPDKLPLCIEGDPVVGSVELNLERETVVRNVTVTVSAHTSASLPSVHNAWSTP